MSLKWPAKDPDEVLDYRVDWTKRLGRDTIETSEWPDAPDGITIVTQTNTTKSTTIWLSGGTLGQNYTFTNRITTAGGRTMDQSVTLPIRAR
jgi:hypothetical protein